MNLKGHEMIMGVGKQKEKTFATTYDEKMKYLNYQAETAAKEHPTSGCEGPQFLIFSEISLQLLDESP